MHNVSRTPRKSGERPDIQSLTSCISAKNSVDNYFPTLGRLDRVQIRGRDKLAEFAAAYDDAKTALESWATAVEAADWKNPADLKRTFASASFVESKTVFNIGGNKYRLVSRINYELKTVLVTHVLTHKEYDKDKWK